MYYMDIDCRGCQRRKTMFFFFGVIQRSVACPLVEQICHTCALVFKRKKSIGCIIVSYCMISIIISIIIHSLLLLCRVSGTWIIQFIYKGNLWVQQGFVANPNPIFFSPFVCLSLRCVYWVLITCRLVSKAHWIEHVDSWKVVFHCECTTSCPYVWSSV